MEILAQWALPLVAVAVLAGLTLLFAQFIGRWIDSQSASVVGAPRTRRPKRRSHD